MDGYTYNGCRFHFNPIMEYNTNGGSVKCALLGHPLYYLQNGFNIASSFVDDTEKYFNICAAKALMILMSFPFDFNNKKRKSFFNSDSIKNGGYEMVPYGYIMLLGGLIYRLRYFEEYGKDLIRTWDENNNPLYKAPSSNETFYIKSKSGIRFGILPTNSKLSYVSFNDIVSKNMPYHIQNALVASFKDFVLKTGEIFENIELQFIENESGSESEKESEDNKLKEDIEGIKYYFLSYQDINKLVTDGASDGGLGILKYLNGINDFTLSADNVLGKITLNINYYTFLYVENKSIKLIYNEENTELQLLFDKIYNHMCGVITNRTENRESDDCVISKSVYANMLSGFSTALKAIGDKYIEDKKAACGSSITSVDKVNDDDIKKAIYMYLKQFWDKWLCDIYTRSRNNITSDNGEYVSYDKIESDSSGYRQFSAAWFENQFLFINSLYVDISDSLKLNLNILKELLTTSISSDSKSGVHVHNHLANVAERHTCNYFCYPDFINFGRRNSDGTTDTPEKMLADIFKPRPYSNVDRISIENQFVIMLANGAQVCDSSGSYKGDSFEIHPRDSFADSNDTAIQQIPYTFRDGTLKYTNENRKLRLGYQVPAFGVAFSKQLNSIFQSIDVGMDTQQITEQSIKSLCYISQLGNSNRRAISFYGNDIYGVYSGYSYIVSVTMLGDAQIQPLMYFQLMNIPMFRGTYMIIEVKHNIKPGDFTTTFRGMKLSQIAPPMTGSWFTIPSKSSKVSDGSNDGCGTETITSASAIGSNTTANNIDAADTSVASIFSIGNISPSKIRVGTSGSSYDPYYNNNTYKNPTGLKPTNPNIKLVAPAPMFIEEYGTGMGQNYCVINGHLVSEHPNHYGGIIIYKDGTFAFKSDGSSYKFEIQNNLSNISYSMQNLMCITNGTKSYNSLNSFPSRLWRCLAQIGDSTVLSFIFCKKPSKYNQFQNALLKIGVKNAFYFDNNGNAQGIWCRVSDRNISNTTGRVKDGVYYFGDGGKENINWLDVGSVMYVVN